MEENKNMENNLKDKNLENTKLDLTSEEIKHTFVPDVKPKPVNGRMEGFSNTELTLGIQMNLMHNDLKNIYKNLNPVGYYFADADFYKSIGRYKLFDYIFIRCGVLGNDYSKYETYQNNMIPSEELTKFKSALQQLKTLPFFVSDYADKSNKFYHIVVIKLPVENSTIKAYKGEYSKMYSEEQLYVMLTGVNGTMYSSKKNNEAVMLAANNIFRKTDKGKAMFIEILREYFGFTTELDDISSREFLLPISAVLSKEILSYDRDFELKLRNNNL